jgi:WD40 repeat protein
MASRDVLWNLTDPTRPTRTAQFDGGEPVAYNPAGTLLATHPTRTTTTLWRVGNGSRPARLGTFAESGGGVFTPDGRTFVADDDTITALWDVTDPARAVRLARLTGGGTRPLSPDGATLATRTDAGVMLWNLTDRARPRRIGILTGTTDPANPGGGTGQPVFAPDSHTIAVGSRDGAVALFDTATAAHISTLPPTPGSANNDVQIGASDTLTTIGFAPDGRTLSVITGNATLSVWDIADPTRPVRTRMLTRHTNGAGRIGFSPDTTTAASAAADGGNSITLWHLR